MTTVYFAGGEDINFTMFAGMVANASGGRFRPAFARCSIGDGSGSAAALAQNCQPFTATTFWAQARFCNSFAAGQVANTALMTFADSSAVIRLRLVITSALVAGAVTFKVTKISAALVETTLFTGSIIFDAVGTGQEATALTFNINYAVAGSIQLYYKGVSIGSFSGDITTDSVTSLSFIQLRGTGGGNNCFWSECIVGDFDPRSCSLQTFAPVANGNTHNFDTGTPAAANVNETLVSDATIDGSTTAGQIDEYTTAAVATGTFAVIAYGVSARALQAAGGPSKMDLAVRTAATDFFSSDITLLTTFTGYQNWFVNNPNTGVPWLTSQIGNTAGFNIGIKSVT